MTKQDWYRLDNAAKIFPSIITNRTTTVFRISCHLYEFVDPLLLSIAVNATIDRFPYYKVKLKNGFFWHYLQNNEAKIPVLPEIKEPCRKIDKKECFGYLFRIIYFKEKISIEMSHILTDGTGALIFLKAVVAHYLALKGNKITDYGDIFHISQNPSTEEFEDSYKKYYNKKIPHPLPNERAFHLPEKLDVPDAYNIVTGVINVSELLKKCKEFGVTITELLAAIYILSLLKYIKTQPPKIRKKLLKPIRVMIPINLRKLFPSSSMRNFFLTVMPGIDPRLGEYTFEEILKKVHHFMRFEIDDKFIKRQITRNVGSELHPIIRTVPLFIKTPFEEMIYRTKSAYEHSGVLTNLGQVSMPDEISDCIKKFIFIPNPNPLTKLNIGVVSWRDKIYITFGNLTNNNEVPRHFFSRLRKMGLGVKIETN